ncbi:MAG TPA: EscU/YscU/HrcU family type III secretion system export apparatus switch protein [bacterium]|nr:EscU/YscU/HrcU family type III secretion system export apparatus switch protein [bacterium]
MALRYDKKSMPAPLVVAKGRGVIAEKLIELARQNGVPILEDRLLVETLDQLNVSQEIPPELYQVVAEILVTIYKAETGQRKK